MALGPPLEMAHSLAQKECPELAAFAARIGPAVGFNFSWLKPAPLVRRLQAMMIEAGQPDLMAFADWLEAKPDRLAALPGKLTVHVSSFFRDAKAFDWLAKSVLPEQLKHKHPLRFWSVGCANGAELYGLAMLMEEAGALERAYFLGTDLDRHSLDRAQSAIYSAEELLEVSPERLHRHFQPTPNSDRKGHKGHHWVAPSRLRSACHWRLHNALTEGIEGLFDVILCRNVAIYLSIPGQILLFSRLAMALQPGGCLLVGRSERVPPSNGIGLVPLAPQAYRKEGVWA